MGSRTLLAVLLLAVGLAVPSVAWYVAGKRIADREVRQALEEPRREADRIAGKLAAQLAERLEVLRARESSRPFYHYQALYHDPAGAAEGPAVASSPLSRGPDDPLVMAHFEVGANGALTMPTLGAAPAPAAVVARDREVARRLEPIVPALTARLMAPLPAAGGGRVETLAQSAYAQNLQAPQLYRDIKRKQAGRPAQGPEIPVDERPVAVETSRFLWTTLAAPGGGPLLAAIRTVRGPSDRRLQGFIVDGVEVGKLLDVTDLSARFAPAAPDSIARGIVAPVGLTNWTLTIDAAAAMPVAQARALAIRGRFHRGFALGLLAAVLAGLAVIALLWQSERLALQRSRFAAAAAHELRTPLAGLRMYGEMLAEGLGEPARARDYARTIAAEAERLGRVVANVLGFTRLERGALRVNAVPGDLAALVRGIVDRHRPALEAAGAAVSLEVEPGLPAGVFDPDAVHQILHNLLDNAERHTRQAVDRRIEVSIARTASGLALTVADHGPGMAGAAGGARPHRSPSPAAGLGLGLRMVEALARAQGGDVAYVAHAEPGGGGARVTVTLPAA